MRRTSAAGIAATIAAGIFICTKAAFAHRIDEYLQATLLSLETNRVQASMRLIPGILVSQAVIAGIDSNGDGVFSEGETRAYAQSVLADLTITLDGGRVQPTLLSWEFPEPSQIREGLGEIHIEYSIGYEPNGSANQRLVLTNHHSNANSVYLVNALLPQDPAIHILAQKRNEKQSTYELDYQQTGTVATGLPTLLRNMPAWLSSIQFSTLFRLGMRHIAEGTDHLLFLLVLLLPAPLLASRSGWGLPTALRSGLIRILDIVTAFTLGHSITLSLAVFNAVRVPSRPVEVLIAVSILVSAVHAFRPLFPGKEAWVAGFFGVIHGLAFAATLDRLGLARWDRVMGILAFNLGIETMQLLVVAAILPSLILISRTQLYSCLRIGGALFAGVASIGWILGRLFNLATPVDAVMNVLAQHALLIAVNLLKPASKTFDF